MSRRGGRGRGEASTPAFNPKFASTPRVPPSGAGTSRRPIGRPSGSWSDGDSDDGGDNASANSRRDPNSNSSTSSPGRRGRSAGPGRSAPPPAASPMRRGRSRSSNPPSSSRADNRSGAGTSRRKQARPKRNNWAREIQMYQKTTRLLIPVLPFCRVVKEIGEKRTPSSETHEPLRWKKQALDALHEATEAFLVQHFEIANMITLHTGRVTLMQKDMRLATRIASVFSSLYEDFEFN